MMAGVGHCGKTEAILHRFVREQKSHDWLVIADDDTLLRYFLKRDFCMCSSGHNFNNFVKNPNSVLTLCTVCVCVCAVWTVC